MEINKLFGVNGKIVLVTGGSRGIGKMIASGFVQNGAKVYITARSEKDCEKTAKELNDLGPGQCIPIVADLLKLSEVERLVAELRAREKVLHVLVNNAGIVWSQPIDRYSDDGFSKVLTLNVQRVFSLTQKCLPLLRAAANESGKDGKSWKDPARIINIGSFDGLKTPVFDSFAYSASKAALDHMSRHLAGRLGWEGITSNTVACGPFETKMMAGPLKMIGSWMISQIPLERIGSPEDVAGTALYLASRAGAWVNGATILLDGGTLAAPATGKPKL